MRNAFRYPSLDERDALEVGSIVVTACVALFARLHPTTLEWWNAVLSIGFAAVVAVAGSRAGRRSVYWILAVATIATALSNPIWVVPSLIGFGLNAWSLSNQRRNLLRALATIGAFGSLVNINALSLWGIPSVVTAIAVTPVIVSAYQRSNPHQRQLARTFAVIVAILATMIGGAAGLSAARALDHAVAARAQLESAQGTFSYTDLDESIESTRTQLDRADQALRATSDVVASPLGRIGRFAPVASQHLAALDRSAIQARRALGAGVGLLESARGATDSTSLLDADRIEAIAATASMAEPILVDASSQLRNTPRDWLVPQAVDAIGNATDLTRRASIATATTADVGTTLPGLLGFTKPARYLVLFATPAESREFGGFVGAYGVVEFDQAEPSLIAAGDNEMLGIESARLGRSLPTDGFSPWYRDYEPQKYPQNVTGSVDFNVIADAALSLFDGLADTSFDGVIYADPFALEAIVALGPAIELTDAQGEPVRLDGTTTADFLLRDQYWAYPRASDRTEVLIDVFEQSFSAVGESLQHRPVDVVTALEPLVTQGRLQIAPADPQARDVLAKYGMVRAFPAPSGTDFLSIVQTNATTSKLDAYIAREVNYSVQIDPATGAMSADVVVTLSSAANDSLPDYVYGAPDPTRDRAPSTDSVLLSAFTPHDLAGISIDGEPVEGFRSFMDAGYQRHMVQVDVPAQQSVVVRYELTGSVNRGNYALSVANQPLSAPDTWSIELNAPSNWRIETRAKGEPARFEDELREDLTLLWVLSS